MPVALRYCFESSPAKIRSAEQERPRPQLVGCQIRLPACGTSSRNPVAENLHLRHRRRRISQCLSNRVKWWPMRWVVDLAVLVDSIIKG